jgi:hypothetical protein
LSERKEINSKILVSREDKEIVNADSVIQGPQEGREEQMEGKKSCLARKSR